MITKVTDPYIDDNQNNNTLTHYLSTDAKTKFQHVNKYYGFVNRYTGSPNRERVKDTIIRVIHRTIRKINLD